MPAFVLGGTWSDSRPRQSKDFTIGFRFSATQKSVYRRVLWIIALVVIVIRAETR